MSTILEDFSESALVTAIEANQFAVFNLFGRWARVAVDDGPEMLAVSSDIPHPLFNSILRARLAPDTLDATVEATVARYDARNVPVMWWIGPATRPPDLGQRLQAHGFVFGGDLAGMAADLHALNEGAPVPPGLEVEQVRDAETLQPWGRVFAAGFDMPESVADPWIEFVGRLDFDHPMRNYLGRLDGEPVAASSLFLGAGVAGIYSVATLPTARRQGIGAAMTLRALLDARELGYRVAILHATPMGAGVYRGLGFRDYCTIGLYVRPARS